MSRHSEDVDLVLLSTSSIISKNATTGAETAIDVNELTALNNIAAADLAKIDGITNGTAAAGKALVLGASGEIATITTATITTANVTTGNITTASVGAVAGSDSSLGIDGQAAAQGGAIVITGGTSSTAGNAGGDITVTGGTPGATSAGGAITITSGAGGATSGASGAVTVASGTTTAGSGSATGNVIMQSGAGAASAAAVAGGASGTVTVRSQAGGANTGGATGQAGGAGGAIAVTGGAGGATNSAGAHAGGAGAEVTITAGAGGAASAGTGNGGKGGDIYLVPGDGGATTGGTAGKNGAVVIKGTAGLHPLFLNVTRTTVGNAGTATAANFATHVLFQDASGGNVTMTADTGANLDLAFPDVQVGNGLMVFHSSNHATNTSTIAGTTGTTLVGSGAVTQTGGQYMLIKTGANAWDLVRVG